MPMIACPGCGLPRADDQIGVVPCPVCAVASQPEPGGLHPPLAGTETRDPTAGLPADVSQLEGFAAHASGGSSRWVTLAVVFLVGIAVGVGGLLAWQRMSSSGELEQVAGTGLVAPAPAGVNPPLAPIPVAPMPREARPVEIVSEPTPEPGPEPRAVPEAPALARKVVIDLNQPDASYTVPNTVKKGEHLILRGKVRSLRITGLGSGAILDATELEVGRIDVGGKIDGGSVLKIGCQDGNIEFTAAVGGKSRVEINAPDSRVCFVLPTKANRPGSRIDGGSTVVITGRTVVLNGDVDGEGTTVMVTLTRNGSLNVAAIRGTAAVEYKAADANGREPNATAFLVDPTARFKKLD